MAVTADGGRSNDFCNAFWSQSTKRLTNAVGGGAFEEYGRDGFEALLGRMKAGTRTLDDLRAILKERATLEEEYAKRISKISKQTKLGQGETGHIERAMLQLKQELDQCAKSHSDLANLLRMQDATVQDFALKRENGRKSAQTQVEKVWKAKKEQREYANKAKAKYESDAININTMFAQLSITQGSEHDKIQANMDKRQQTLAVNERDYKNYVSVLRETTQTWNMQWKSFCDLCQDQEEERLEFVKARMWDWANALSTVAMQEDESAERTRTALEQCEPARDLLIFVHNASTGSDIPDPPAFHDMRSSEPFKQTFKQARFARSSTRGAAMKHSPSAVDDIAKVFNHGGPPSPAKRQSIPSQVPSDQGPTLQSALPQQQTQNHPANSSSNAGFSTDTPPSRFSVSPSANPRQAAERLSQSSNLPASLRPGQGAAPAALFQQRQPSSTGPPSAVASNVAAPSGSDIASPTRSQHQPQTTAQTGASDDDDDPILKALQQISSKSPVPTSPATRARTPNRFSSSVAPSEVSVNRFSRPASEINGPGSSASQQAPHSPAPIATMMQQPAQAQSPAVLAQYGQSFPGERTSSRQNLAQSPSSNAFPTSPSSGPALANRLSQPNIAGQDGFAGVGARGRSPSPQPFQQSQQSYQQQHQQQPTSYHQQQGAYPQQQYQQYQQQPRPPSQVQIARPPSIQNVAQAYQQPAACGVVPSPSQSSFHQQQPSYSTSASYSQQPTQSYAAPPQAATPAQHHQQSQPTYQPQQQQQPYPSQYGSSAAPPPAQYAAHHGRSPSAQTLTQQQHPSAYANPSHPNGNGQYRAPTDSYAAPPPPASSAPPPSNVSSISAYSQASNGAQGRPTPLSTSPSVPPTGQWTDDGKPILFYVSALYAYQATSAEEFSFAQGDVIAVTATDPDGWWTGQPVGMPGPGKLFPSNFTELLS